MSDTNLNNLNLDDLEFLNYEGTAHLVEKVNTKIDEKIAVETERATTKENEISSALEEEISRATSAETTKVDKTTTVNGKALSENITLTASDVGADASGSADTALTNAKEYANDVYENATSYTDKKIADLINGAPSTLDTLGEISDAMKENESVVEALDQAIGSKANQLEMDSHTGNGTIHITSTERNTWNAVTNKVDKVDGKGLSTNDYTNEEKAQVEANKNDILLLKEDIEGMQGGVNDIVTTTSDTLENSKAGGYKLVKMVANTIQNGTPSPITPIPMLSTGECVEMMQGRYIPNSGIYENATFSVCNKYKIPCESGDKISFELGVIGNVYVIFYNESGYVNYGLVIDNAKNGEITVPSGVTHFTFDVTRENITPETAGKITITINGKYLNVVKTRGKNLFDERKLLYASGWSKTDGWYRGGAWNLYRARNDIFSDIIYKENTQYTVKVDTKGGSVFTALALMIIYTDGTDEYKLISNSDLSECSTTVITKNGKSVKSIDTTFTDDSIVYIKDFLIQEGAIENPTYEPYKETIAYFLTDYPMIKGSTLFRENGLVKAMHCAREKEINGNVALFGITEKETGNVHFAIPEFGVDAIPCDNNNEYTFSDYLSTWAIDTNGGIWTEIPKTVLASVDANGILAWFSEHLPKVQYPLATPIIETLDTQSQIALNGLETFEGMTIVEFDTRVQPLEFVSTYGTTEVGAIALEASNKADMPVDTNDYVHPNSGVTAGTYRSVTVNAQGHVTAGANPTVTIAQGGTGATTAAGALTNLGITATATELNHVDGVTSNIQTQLNAKQPKEATVFSMQNNYVAVRTSGRTAAQYYEFYDSCGWAGIQAGQITAKVEFVGNLTGNVTGNAATATALTSNGGSATQPVYFSGGKPVACTYTLGKSVPSNAVFTDTVYTHPSSHPSSMITGLGGAATCSVSSATDTTSTTTLLNLTGANNLQKQINTVSTNLGKIKITIKTYTVVPSSSTYVSPYKYFTSENISGDVGTYGTPVYASASGVNGVSLPCKLFRTTSGVWRVDLAAMTDYTITYWVTYISGVSCTIV